MAYLRRVVAMSLVLSAIGEVAGRAGLVVLRSLKSGSRV
jgi:hypothetical protein